MTTIQGFEELDRKLTKLAGQMTGRQMLTALQAGARPLVNEIKVQAPVLTGNLRRSYHDEPGRTTEHSAELIVGTDVEYAPYQEFGTRYQPGKPHVRPAIDMTQRQVLEEIKDVAELLIRKATR